MSRRTGRPGGQQILRRTILAVLVSLLMLAGCATDPRSEIERERAKQPPLEPAIAALTDGLSHGDLTQVPTTPDSANADLQNVLAGMQGLRPTVTAEPEPHRTSSAAEVQLKFSWPLSSPWEYETKANMTLRDDKWLFVWQPSTVHPKLDGSNRMERQREPGKRGSILGEGGTVLVEDTEVLMLGIDKTKVEEGDPAASARDLAKILDMNPNEYADRVTKAAPNAFVEAKAVPLGALPGGFYTVDGGDTRTATRPTATPPGFARAIVGDVTQADVATAESSEGTIYPGDYVGTSGLQKTFNPTLRAAGSNKVYLAPRDTEPGSGEPHTATLLADYPKSEGEPVHSNVNQDIQAAAEAAVNDARTPASVVVLRVNDGGVVAAADSPFARDKTDSLTQEFSPGLASAPVSQLALLRSGVGAKDKLDCVPGTNVGGHDFNNSTSDNSRSGQQELEDIIGRGCTTALANSAQRVQPQVIADAAASLGIGTPHDVGLPVSFGTVPVATDDRGKALQLIGENSFKTSPLGLAAMGASIRSGQTIVPWFAQGKQPGADAPPLAENEANALRDAMKVGAQQTSVSNLDGVLTGEADGKEWLVGYNDQYAIAVLTTTDARSSDSAQNLAKNALKQPSGSSDQTGKSSSKSSKKKRGN